MILPQTDHAGILIAAASLLTQAENAFVTSHDVTIVPLEAVEAVRWGYKLHRRDDVNHHHGWSHARNPRDQRNRSQVRNVRLAVSYTTMADASKSALFPHCCRIATLFVSSLDAALPFLACSIRARRCFRISDKKNIVSDKCHKLSFYFLHI